MDKESQGPISPGASLNKSPPESTHSSSFPVQTKPSSNDEPIPQASLSGLQTAYSLLQKQHRDSLRRNHDLSNKVKVLEKLLTVDEKAQGIAGQMEGYITSNGDLAAGAGASNEDDTVTAELRAKQGYISHLEKEVLRNNNVIARGNEEIQRLKHNYDEMKRDMVKTQRELERVKSDFEAVNETLAKERETSLKKDMELQKLKASADTEQDLVSQISSLTEKLHVYERGAVTSREAEVTSLKSRLAVADNEMKKLYKEYLDLKEKFDKKDKEVQVLEIKCRQYEIQVGIRKDSMRGMDNADEVDGDLVVLNKLLTKVVDQKSELDEMRMQMQEQQTLIKAITESKPNIEDRGSAVGNSMHFLYAEHDRPQNLPFEHSQYTRQQVVCEDTTQHFVTNQSVRSQHGSSFSPITRRRSDKSDYRSSKVAKTSPRILDAVKPTGNRSIHSMVAAELPAKTAVAGNVFDSCVEMSRNSPRLSDGLSNLVPVVSGSPIRKRRDSGEYYNTSPRTIKDQPSPITDLPKCDTSNSSRQFYLQDSSAQPRLPANANYLNLQCEAENVAPHTTHRIPNRMTQSEIHLRESADANFDLTKYAQPLQPLLIPSDPGMKLDANNVTENMYANTPIAQNVPNYENISQVTSSIVREPMENEDRQLYGEDNQQTHKGKYLNASAQRIVPRQASQDNTVVTPLRTGMDSRSANADPGLDDVSVVKICPSCNKEFSRLTMDEFQAHVYDCFDNGEEGPPTILAAEDDDRVCPMCSAVFPLTIAQEIYEQHVFAHFGEEAMMDGFEMLS